MHIGAADTLVGVSHCGEEPLGDGALPAVGREEVVEDGSVDWAHRLLTEVVVVSLDLGAAVVVRVLDEHLDHVCVLSAEISQGGVLAGECAVLKGGDEAIELLLLVAVAVLLHDDGSSEVLKELSAEILYAGLG